MCVLQQRIDRLVCMWNIKLSNGRLSDIGNTYSWTIAVLFDWVPLLSITWLNAIRLPSLTLRRFALDWTGVSRIGAVSRWHQRYVVVWYACFCLVRLVGALVPTWFATSTCWGNSSIVVCIMQFPFGYPIIHWTLPADSVACLSGLFAGRLQLIGSSFSRKHNSSKSSCLLL